LIDEGLEMSVKHVVITGVSTGIGYGAAVALASDGYHIFGSVRREEDGARLQQELGDCFTPLLFDVTDETAVRAAAAKVGEMVDGRGLAGLVNNAGIAVPGPLMHLSPAEFRRQLEVNLVAVLSVTQAFLPLLGARKDPPPDHPPGRIVNVSSVSGHITYPFMVGYSVSKHGLEALSDGWRRELMIYGIDVIVVAPGKVQTPIWDKAEQVDLGQFAATDYAPFLPLLQKTIVRSGRSGMPVARVTAAIREALAHPRPKSRYILARKWFSGWFLPRWLPDRWFDRLIARRAGFE
jgi:NAD(P)-dependent dehydrogenase (short-subunit alcohol dehydrogenase family)